MTPLVIHDEPAFLREVAALWAGLGGGPNEGVGTCRWCKGKGTLWMRGGIETWCGRCAFDNGKGWQSGERPARNLAPYVARLLLRAAREAEALYPGALSAALDDVQAWQVLADRLQEAWGKTWPAALTQGRDLTVLRLLTVGLQGEAGEVLRRCGMRRGNGGVDGDGTGVGVHRSHLATLQPLLDCALLRLLLVDEGRYGPSARHVAITPQGLTVACTLWGGCDGVYYADLASVHRGRIDGRCTLVAGHTGGCRWEGGDTEFADDAERAQQEITRAILGGAILPR